MQALIVLKAIGDALGAINNIYQFVKNVQEFFGNPTDENRQRYLAALAAIMQVRGTILQASAEILFAIQALDERLFRQAISEGSVARRLQPSQGFIRNLDVRRLTTSPRPMSSGISKGTCTLFMVLACFGNFMLISSLL
jgi:hypothetical protein